MTEETRPEAPVDTPQPADSATAVATPEATTVATPEAEAKPEEQKKLRQDVEIKDIGPCKKYVKVTVNREDIDSRFGDHFSKLVKDSVVPGFRPGKAPRRIVESAFKKDVGEQVKREVLMASLEQLEDYDIAPLSTPHLELDKIEIPKTGPLVYEFEVEVRPSFDLPNYRGLKLKRYIQDFGEADVAQARRRILADQSQIVPKEGGAVELGDVVVADVSVRHGDKEVSRIPENQFTVEKQLSFKDGLARKFGEQIKGAKAGEDRVVEIEMASAAAGGLGGTTVKATFHVKDVKTLRLPELTPEFVLEHFALASADQLDEAILVSLKRSLEHENRRLARTQIIEQIADASKWELPKDLLERQARRALSRRIMEMKADGMTDEEINKKARLLQQNVLEMTELSLREHFVLQKIAEIEKIDIDDDDLNDEIERIADQEDESPRRVRARLEKEQMLEALAAEMIERKALDLILDAAQYEDVTTGQDDSAPVSSVEVQAVPGEMKEMPSAEAQPEGTSSQQG